MFMTENMKKENVPLQSGMLKQWKTLKEGTLVGWENYVEEIKDLTSPLSRISLPEKLETQRLKFTDVVGYLNKPRGKFFPKGKKETVNEAKLSLNCFFKYRSPYQFFFKWRAHVKDSNSYKRWSLQNSTHL